MSHGLWKITTRFPGIERFAGNVKRTGTRIGHISLNIPATRQFLTLCCAEVWDAEISSPLDNMVNPAWYRLIKNRRLPKCPGMRNDEQGDARLSNEYHFFTDNAAGVLTIILRPKEIH